MTCAVIRQKLELMADDELSSEQAAAVLSHLEDCTTCNEQWYAILHLRRTIKEKAASFSASADFEERLIKALHAEAQQQQDRSNSTLIVLPTKAYGRAPYLKIAAALLVVGAAATIVTWHPGNNLSVSSSPEKVAPPLRLVQAPPAVAAASLDDAIKNFDLYLSSQTMSGATTANKETISPGSSDDEIASLSERAGFKIKTMALDGFTLSAAQIVTTANGKTPLVRLCYTRTSGKKNGANGQNDSIICYQAPGGKLIAKGLNEHFIDGRTICCGEKRDKSIVFIPGRKPAASTPEILLLSNISKSDLMDLVLSSS